MSNKMWGGRFADSPDAVMEEINASIGFDRHLYRQDIAASKAHAAMLGKQGIITADDAAKITHGLDTIRRDRGRNLYLQPRARRHPHECREPAGRSWSGAAGRLHTARSRNDQVATDFRLWVRATIDQIGTTRSPATRRRWPRRRWRTPTTVMPGFTHLQTAQPVTFGHHLLAYVEMAARDRGRFKDARERLDESPLGAAALAGTAFPIDRDMTAEGARLRPADGEFARCRLRPRLRARDVVRGVDHRRASSRFAEEIVIWTSPLAGLLLLSDRFTSGSSIMPQKRNPDAAELVRAKTGRIIGASQALLIVMKGLPLAYQKDMQEDKEGTMDALSALLLSIAAMTGMVRDMLPDAARMRAAADGGYSTATDLADWLVNSLKIPFRDAHHVTGRIVAKAASDGVTLDALPLHEMQAIEPRITQEVFAVLSADNSVKSRVSYGGTAPKNVRREANRWLKALAREIVMGASRNSPCSCRGDRAMVPGLSRGGVIVISRQNWARVAAVGVLVAALGLSACGRKGPLDPPPSAAGHSAQDAPAPGAPCAPQSGPPGQQQMASGRDGKAVAPPPSGQSRPFILDWLVE